MSEAAFIDRLDRLADHGQRLDFWLRDDDVTEPTPALDRLIGLCNRHHVPVLLAAIPAGTGAPLAQRLAPEPLVRMAVHGWAHQNHAPPGEKKQELGPHRPTDTVADQLSEGVRHLSTLFGPHFVPVLVPPWNRIAPQVVTALPGIGFRALSVFGPEKPGPLPQINTHVDLIDWRGSRGVRPAEDLFADLNRRIDAVVAARSGSVGLLGHHLVHDAAAWDFLDRVLALAAAHPACRWPTFDQMMPATA